MTSLKLLVLAGTIAFLQNMPAVAGTTASVNRESTNRESAKSLGGTVQPSITLFTQSGDPIVDKSADLNLQVSGKPRLSTPTDPDIWESELLDNQRRTEPGFITITAD